MAFPLTTEVVSEPSLKVTVANAPFNPTVPASVLSARPWSPEPNSASTHTSPFSSSTSRGATNFTVVIEFRAMRSPVASFIITEPPASDSIRSPVRTFAPLASASQVSVPSGMMETLPAPSAPAVTVDSTSPTSFDASGTGGRSGFSCPQDAPRISAPATIVLENRLMCFLPWSCPTGKARVEHGS